MKMENNKRSWKKNAGTIIFLALMLFFLINTNAKSWLLKQVLKTGLFSPTIENTGTDSSSVFAMPLTYRDQNGVLQSTENMRGKTIFINFWASWCPPCVAEMPSMNSMYLNLKDQKDLSFIFINLDEQIQTAKEFLKKNQYDIPLQRAEGFIPTDLYTGTLPTTIVLNKEGHIVLNHTGMENYNTEKFKEKLKALD